MKQKSLHILMLTEYFHPFDRGGSEWSIFHLSQGLIERGHQISLFTPNYGSVTYDVFKRIKIYRFPFYKRILSQEQALSPIYFANPLWWFQTSWSLFKYIRQNRVDLLHVQGKYLLPAAVIIGKLMRIPVILTMRDYIPLCPYGYCLTQAREYKRCGILTIFYDLHIYQQVFHIKKTLKNQFLGYITALNGWFISSFLRFFILQSNKIVTISKKTAFIYKQNQIQAQVIYNTTNFTSIKKTSAKNYLIFIGRLTPGKGVDILLEAYRKVKLERKDLPGLLIIGAGPFENLIKVYSQFGVYYLGRLSHEKTLNYLSHAHLTIVPGLWEEPFGRVALESLSYGVPVVTTRRGGLPEVVTHGKTGIITRPTVDGLAAGLKKALSQEPALRKGIRDTYPMLKKKFFDFPVNAYEKIYYQVL